MLCTQPRQNFRPRFGMRVRFPPILRQFARYGGLEQRTTEDLQAFARLRQRCLAFRDLGEQRVDPRHDAALFWEWGEGHE
jgi:hypothetical protein